MFRVGKTDKEPAFTIDVAPNPAADELYVTVGNKKQLPVTPAKNETLHIALYTSFDGREVRSWKFRNTQNTRRLSLEGIRQGYYVLAVTIGKDKYTKIIFIKN